MLVSMTQEKLILCAFIVHQTDITY